MGDIHYGNLLTRTLRAALLCMLVFAFCVSHVRADENGAQGAFDLILEVKHGRNALSSATLAFQKNNENYLPMHEIARLVQFQATLDIDAETISGFFLKEDNTYALNVQQGTYSVRGTSFPLPDGSVFVDNQGYGVGDIYITEALMNYIWPLQIKFSMLDQSIQINTPVMLPYQLALQRDNERANRQRGLEEKSQETDLNLVAIKGGYKLFSLPAVNINNTLGWRNADKELSEQLSVSGRQDFLKAEADYTLSLLSDNDSKLDLNRVRARFTRRDFGKDPMPLGLRLMQGGDVSTRASSLIDGGIRGRGVIVSSKPQVRLTNFDNITVEGIATPGWEVELYRGNELLAFDRVRDNGEYRFEDITIGYGGNEIRVVLYGPEGQTEERVEKYRIGSNMVQPGMFEYEASLIDSDRDLINVNTLANERPEGWAQNYRVAYGLSKSLSLFSTYTTLPTFEGDKKYATLGLNAAILGGLAQLEGYKELGAGYALDARYVTKFAGINMNVRGSVYDNFESNTAGFNDRALSLEGNVTASKGVRLPFGGLGLRLEADHEEYRDGNDNTSYRFTQIFNRKSLNLTHNITTRTANSDHRGTRGDISASYRISPKWNFRSFLNYSLFPEKEYDTLRTELRYDNRKRFSAQLDFEKDLQDKDIKLGGQIGYQFDKVLTSLDLDRRRGSGFDVFLRTNFSLAPYNSNFGYVMSGENLVRRSGLRGRVFKDNDLNGYFSEGDEPLEGVSLRSGHRSIEPTQSDGSFTDLRSGKEGQTVIQLDRDTLGDPFLVSYYDGYDVLLRNGIAPYIDFPVVETGAIDGFIMRSETKGFAGIVVQLLDETGEVISTAVTAFDGFYNFEFVRPGEYTVRVDPSYEQVHVAPRSVSVTSEDLFLYGIDLFLTGQAEEEVTSSEAGTKPNVAAESGRIAQLSIRPHAANGEVPSLQQTGRATEWPAPQPTDGSSASFGPPTANRDGRIAQLYYHNVPAETGDPVVVHQVRTGEYSDRLRLVLDLSTQARYDTVTEAVTDDPAEDVVYNIIEEGGREIYIDLPNARWEDVLHRRYLAAHALRGYDVEMKPEGGVRIILRGHDRIRIADHGRFGVADGNAGKLYFDVMKMPSWEDRLFTDPKSLNFTLLDRVKHFLSFVPRYLNERHLYRADVEGISMPQNK